MKTLLLTLALALSAFAADPGADLAPVLAKWKTAMLKGDRATLEKMYHKDLTYTHSNAHLEHKQDSIDAAVKNVAKAIEYRDITTRVYGNTAIVGGKFDITSSEGALAKLEVVMVWLKSGSEWQLVARQATKLQ